MTFDPNRHLIKVQGGRSYLPVSARLIWFRGEHPDWGIETEPITIDSDKNYAIFRAKIYNAEGRLMAMGTKKEDIQGFGDYIEKAETGAVGRALALCGYGTQFAPELDEVSGGRFADSPQGGGGRFGDNPQGGGRAGGNGAGNSGGAGRFERAPSNGSRFERGPENSRPQRAGAPVAEQRPARPTPDDNDNPFGEESPAPAKPVQEATDAKATARNEAPASPPACQNCSKPLTKSQQELSIRNYGAALCPQCQKDSKAREVREAAPAYDGEPVGVSQA